MATHNDHERSAAGMDFDSESFRDRASRLGSTIAENGPEAFFDEIENLLPEAWREHVRSFPIAAMLLGLGVGIFLGMKKGDELIAAGSSLVSAAAMQNVSSVMDRARGEA